VLYSKLLSDHLSELLPIVYDPTVGDAIERYSHEYRRSRGVFLSIDRPQDIEAFFATLELGPGDPPSTLGVCVQTSTDERQAGEDRARTEDIAV
jgi:malic enzyme